MPKLQCPDQKLGKTISKEYLSPEPNYKLQDLSHYSSKIFNRDTFMKYSSIKRPISLSGCGDFFVFQNTIDVSRQILLETAFLPFWCLTVILIETPSEIIGGKNV